ncbi:MAG: helix-turn-helix transcriptional regulator [Bacillota bacterium]|nr:helix-turn-helix transcriptional regulator [Bacillota bacterium]
MTDIEQKKIFSKNLNLLLSQHNKTQKEVADAISVSPQTFNTWCQGIALPRMGKVQRLADYFNIEKADLIEEKNEQSEKYYFNDETAEMAQTLFENRPLRVLFDAAKDATPEDLETTYNMLMALKKKERGNNVD